MVWTFGLVFCLSETIRRGLNLSFINSDSLMGVQLVMSSPVPYFRSKLWTSWDASETKQGTTLFFGKWPKGDPGQWGVRVARQETVPGQLGVWFPSWPLGVQASGVLCCPSRHGDSVLVIAAFPARSLASGRWSVHVSDTAAARNSYHMRIYCLRQLDFYNSYIFVLAPG